VLIEQFSLKNSCCLDFVGCEHVKCDILVHFSEACFSDIERSKEYEILFCFEQTPYEIVQIQPLLSSF